jgi:simple sugar transport system permease protein
MSELLQSILSPLFGYAILRVMTPILFPAIGAGISFVSGSFNISLEASMLVSALIGVIVSAYTQSITLAVLAALAAGMFISLILAFLNLKLRADIILVGIALNLFASGFTVFLLFLTTGSKGVSATLKSLMLPQAQLPLIKNIPVVGQILSGHNLLTYFAIICVIIYYIILYKTPLGLRIRAVGQNADATISTGIKPERIKLIALLLSGLFASFGGIFLSMGYLSSFGRNMSAGRGFIAIGVAVVARNGPFLTLFYSFIFALAITLATYLGSMDFPSELIQVIPYLITIIVLTIYSLVEKNRKKIEVV